MNERIKELKLQAIKLVAESYPCDIEDFTDGIDERVRAKVDEKFAELIVKECADICNKIYFDRYPDAEDFERSEEGDAIKQHFGVEE